MYNNARYYDPKLGRFISADSMVPDAGYSQSFNRYMYVVGNPVSFNDPSGHEPPGGRPGSGTGGGFGYGGGDNSGSGNNGGGTDDSGGGYFGGDNSGSGSGKPKDIKNRNNGNKGSNIGNPGRSATSGGKDGGDKDKKKIYNDKIKKMIEGLTIQKDKLKKEVKKYKDKEKSEEGGDG